MIRREAVWPVSCRARSSDLNRIDIYKRRLGNTGYFGGAGQQQPGQGNPIEVKIINKRPGTQPYGDDPAAGPGDVSLTRMQYAGPEVPEPSTAPPPLDLYEFRQNESVQEAARGRDAILRGWSCRRNQPKGPTYPKLLISIRAAT